MNTAWVRLTARSMIAASLAALSLAVAACNTTKGAGKDIESVGGHIEHAADKANK